MPTPFAPSTLAELAARLEHRRQCSALLAASLLADAASALEDFDISDLLDSDNPNGGSNDIDRDRALALAHLAAGAARAADDALSRIAAGTYGVCDACGDRMPLARLRAMPESRACVSCPTGRGRLLTLARRVP